MSTRTLISQSLALAFTLTTSAIAFAEQPARQGYRGTTVNASCSSTPAAEGGSYRNAVARKSSSAGTAVAGRAAGYREALARTPAQKSNVQVASGSARFCVN